MHVTQFTSPRQLSHRAPADISSDIECSRVVYFICKRNRTEILLGIPDLGQCWKRNHSICFIEIITSNCTMNADLQAVHK